MLKRCKDARWDRPQGNFYDEMVRSRSWKGRRNDQQTQFQPGDLIYFFALHPKTNHGIDMVLRDVSGISRGIFRAVEGYRRLLFAAPNARRARWKSPNGMDLESVGQEHGTRKAPRSFRTFEDLSHHSRQSRWSWLEPGGSLSRSSFCKETYDILWLSHIG